VSGWLFKKKANADFVTKFQPALHTATPSASLTPSRRDIKFSIHHNYVAV
jgi:hypothetical protein